MSYVGMNTDRVRALAGEMDATARQLRGVDRMIERIVADLGGHWQGGDFARNAQAWRSEHRPRLHRLVDAIEGLARSARHNADDQDRASATEYSIGSHRSSLKVDRAKVALALHAVRAALDTGGLSVTAKDMDTIFQAFMGLNSAEARMLLRNLDDGELAVLRDQMRESTIKGGMTSDEQYVFLKHVLAGLSIDEARRLLGPEWALQRHDEPDVVTESRDPRTHVASLFDGLRGQYRDGVFHSRIAPDEIEIRRLDNGSYIVMLPGVQDLTEGFARGGRAAPAGAAAAAAATILTWEGTNSTGSARDMHYARPSEMQGANGSQIGTNAYAFAVKEALRAHGVEQGADVMLVGHSFGAYTAAELGSDPTFNTAMGRVTGYGVNVTHVAAAGASAGFRMNGLPPETAGVLLNNSEDWAYLGERVIPNNNASSDYEIVFNGSRYPDQRGMTNDGFGHEPTNYGAFVRSVNLDQLNAFNESAFSRYGGAGSAIRVTVKDPYR